MSKFRFLGFVLSVVVMVLMVQCSDSGNKEGQQPVVKVENKTLTMALLTKAIPDGLNEEDSVVFAQDYINRWVNSELLLKKAELNLTKEEKDVDDLLEEYRRSLLIHKYQQKLLSQKYSPLVKDNEIASYYQQMTDNFQLSEPIIKGLFIIVPKSAPKIRDLERWCRSVSDDDMIKLEAYCFQNAKKYDVFLDHWKGISKLNSKLPSPIRNEQQFLRYNNFYHTQDSVYHYYLTVREKILSNEVAPLDFVEDKIRAVLLNKKRKEFLKQLESDLYNEGLEKKMIKFY